MSGPPAAAVITAEPEQPARTKEPTYKKITQQDLPACKPVLEPIWVVFIFLAFGVVLIPIGAVCLYYGLKPIEASARYDAVCIPAPNNTAREQFLWKNAANEKALSCHVNITVPEDMNAPVYVYYELTGFYQNHRRYVKSVSSMQLADQNKNQATNLCKPQEYLASNNSNVSYPINPCGLIAWSFFNDTYELNMSRGGVATVSLPVSDSGIAFTSDVKYRFANYTPKNFNPVLGPERGGFNLSADSGGATPKENERFMVWMRLSALPHFRKLWGKIGTDLKKGDVVSVLVYNRYNTYAFDGHKSIVLGTTTWLGGKNPFLGVAFLVTGGLAWLLAVVYLGARLAKPRKFADLTLLSFNKPVAGGS